VDVAPTILDLANVQPYDPMHGQSFVPLLKDPQAPWRKSLLTEYFTEKVGLRVPDWQAVRTERWKYIHYSTLEGMDELYDLGSDPGETYNRVHEPAAAKTLAELQEELRSLLAR
jgi:N-acetylglucosamine-6-sulfatase